MLRARAHVRKPQLVEKPRHRALMILHPEPALDLRPQVNPTPAHHAVGLRIGAGLDELSQFRQLLRAQPPTRPRSLAARKAVRTLGVEATHPVPKRLTAHPAQQRSLGA